MPTAAGACRVVRIEGFTLDVEADAPIVAQELRLHEIAIVDAFRAARGGADVSDLHVTIRRR